MDETPITIERRIDNALLGVLAYAGRALHTTWKLLTRPGHVINDNAGSEYCRPVIYYLVTAFICQFFMTALSLTNAEAMKDPRFRDFFGFTFGTIKDNASHFDAYKLLLILAPEVALMAIFSIGASFKQGKKMDFKHSFSFVAYSFGAISLLKAAIYFIAISVQGYGALGVTFFNSVIGWSLLLNVFALIIFFRITASYSGSLKFALTAIIRSALLSLFAMFVLIIWAAPIIRWYQQG